MRLPPSREMAPVVILAAVLLALVVSMLLVIGYEARHQHECVRECIEGKWAPGEGRSERECRRICSDDPAVAR